MRVCSSRRGACGPWQWRSARASRRPSSVSARAQQPWPRLRHDQYTRAPRLLRATYANPSTKSDGAPRRVTEYQTSDAWFPVALYYHKHCNCSSITIKTQVLVCFSFIEAI